MDEPEVAPASETLADETLADETLADETLADETTADETPASRAGQVIQFPGLKGREVDDFDRADTPGHSRPLWRDVVGDLLRQERLDQQRTLAEVAEEAAVSLPYLSEIERGLKEVSSDVLDAVIQSLGIELADLLDRASRRIREQTADTTTTFEPVSQPATVHTQRGVQGLQARDASLLLAA